MGAHKSALGHHTVVFLYRLLLGLQLLLKVHFLLKSSVLFSIFFPDEFLYLGGGCRLEVGDGNAVDVGLPLPAPGVQGPPHLLLLAHVSHVNEVQEEPEEPGVY